MWRCDVNEKKIFLLNFTFRFFSFPFFNFHFNAQHNHIHIYNSSFPSQYFFSGQHFSLLHHNQHKSPHTKWQMIDMPKYFLFSPNIFISFRRSSVRAITFSILHFSTSTFLYEMRQPTMWRGSINYYYFLSPKIDKFSNFQIIIQNRMKMGKSLNQKKTMGIHSQKKTKLNLI